MNNATQIRWGKSGDIDRRHVAAYVARLLNKDIHGFVIADVHWLKKGSIRDMAILEFKTTLGRLVDQWIESGQINHGVAGDRPHERDITWISAKHPETVFATLWSFWQRQSPSVIIGRDGGLTLQLEAKVKFTSPVDAIEAAKEYAIFEFARLLNSASPERLAKCDACQQYLVRSRVPRKGVPIFHGTFCSKCKGSGAAKRTRESRRRRIEAKIGWAADGLAQWKPTRRHGEKADWIVKQVNSRVGMGKPIKINWVTRHQAEIEAEVERRKNATRKN